MAEKLWDGLRESCLYLFGNNEEFVREMDKMEYHIYFRDEKLAMANERIGVLELEKEKLEREHDKMQAENSELIKALKERDKTIEELKEGSKIKFVRFVRKWRQFMLLS